MNIKLNENVIKVKDLTSLAVNKDLIELQAYRLQRFAIRFKISYLPSLAVNKDLQVYQLLRIYEVCYMVETKLWLLEIAICFDISTRVPTPSKKKSIVLLFVTFFDEV